VWPIAPKEMVDHPNRSSEGSGGATTLHAIEGGQPPLLGVAVATLDGTSGVVRLHSKLLLRWEVIGHSCEQEPQRVYFWGA
jgi:hypothetical protein